ncbi:TetR/AcrR family transcriptional regulator [Pendulispora brunnea]|uniref:TetR/AcrR family transcriptional regulator n=1 Tax=Pendulispora brunnea TaxID=2905690 RepID=A0ABZ2KBS4_9BACT
MLEPRTRPNRRERPAKPALTRDGIIATALAIMQAEGLGKVSMRRLAAELDTGPASLYVYVTDIEDLHAQILDALLVSVHKRLPAGTWRHRLSVLLRRYADVLFAHPELARMAMSTPANGPNYLHLVDTILGFLQEGGASDRNAAWGVDTLLLYVTAHAAEHAAWKESSRAQSDMSMLRATIASADPKTHPHVARLKADLVSGRGERFDWNLDLLIDGIVRAPAATKGKR